MALSEQDGPESQRECRNGVRQQLRRFGWSRWSERHVTEPLLTEHQATLVFTADHPDGPLVCWLHPDGCQCIMSRWRIWEPTS